MRGQKKVLNTSVGKVGAADLVTSILLSEILHTLYIEWISRQFVVCHVQSIMLTAFAVILDNSKFFNIKLSAQIMD